VVVVGVKLQQGQAEHQADQVVVGLEMLLALLEQQAKVMLVVIAHLPYIQVAVAELEQLEVTAQQAQDQAVMGVMA
jgi:hypothetical protein